MRGNLAFSTQISLELLYLSFGLGEGDLRLLELGSFLPCAGSVHDACLALYGWIRPFFMGVSTQL
jgi:hypothetical protein